MTNSAANYAAGVFLVLGRDSIDVAINHERGVAFLIWRFRVGELRFMVDAPLHMGLEDHAETHGLSINGLLPTETGSLIIVIQDEKGVVQRLCSIPIPRLILKRLVLTIRRQIAERYRHDLKHSYAMAIRRFNKRIGTLPRAFAAAMIKAPVA